MSQTPRGLTRFNTGTVDERELVALAAQLARGAQSGGVIHLSGDLGAGKTTFARALLVELGIHDRIKSPTYSLIESYRAGTLDIHHLDLYRIADAAELEWLGVADLCGPQTLLLIEWPERGGNALPRADLSIEFLHVGDGRKLSAIAASAGGEAMLTSWRNILV
ncbi:MAG: tRNA (adenosine(37)-N6)-threonylcarbamoyltransferase complex ATPase subunit type 1 TsaE [Dokdonella sp.]|uniref:tRNA (adenosine(37)-N6)-threonylcarbamoyltransferase complex ATPase subunit type 1 TsaE n=1 Tax=Dokdonella sp. TaxID=2291710 RepID=UPI0032652D1F